MSIQSTCQTLMYSFTIARVRHQHACTRILKVDQWHTYIVTLSSNPTFSRAGWALHKRSEAPYRSCTNTITFDPTSDEREKYVKSGRSSVVLCTHSVPQRCQVRSKVSISVGLMNASNLFSYRVIQSNSLVVTIEYELSLYSYC